VRSRRVSSVKDFLSPTSSRWADIAPESIPLTPTPLAMQPTEYIRRSWQDRAYGAARMIEAATVHDRHDWALLAQWEGVSPVGSDFPDSLAVALPVRGQPVLMLMGSAEAPIHYLRWRAGKEGVLSQMAGGIGKSRPGPALHCSVHVIASGSRWRLVISRPMGGEGDVAPLRAGRTTNIGFAVWHGANDERGGIKAVSMNWTELVLEA